MKLKSLNIDYLTGIIDGKIADYSENNTSTDGLDLNYVIELPEKKIYNDYESRTATKAKITFSWNNGKTYKEEETNFAEDKRDDYYFTILAGEPVIKLQEYVGELLDRLTA